MDQLKKQLGVIVDLASKLQGKLYETLFDDYKVFYDTAGFCGIAHFPNVRQGGVDESGTAGTLQLLVKRCPREQEAEDD